jgi:hypothetical protein
MANNLQVSTSPASTLSWDYCTAECCSRLSLSGDAVYLKAGP